ncbi:MAG: large subunit ribosomal protein L10 [Candidatus Paceibacteria bacterium]
MSADDRGCSIMSLISYAGRAHAVKRVYYTTITRPVWADFSFMRLTTKIIMAITKAQKEVINAKLSTALTNSATAVFVSFTGLGVEDNNILRKQLRANDSDYLVAKKTLLKRAMDAAKVSGDQPDLGEGMVAVAFGTDPMAPAREVFEFSKTNKDSISIMGGIFDGSFKSQVEMMDIATIPGMDALRGMFANVINSPVQRFAVVLGQVAEKKA